MTYTLTFRSPSLITRRIRAVSEQQAHVIAQSMAKKNGWSVAGKAVKIN